MAWTIVQVVVLGADTWGLSASWKRGAIVVLAGVYVIGAVIIYRRNALGRLSLAGGVQVLVLFVLTGLFVWLVSGGRPTIQMSSMGLVSATRPPFHLTKDVTGYLLKHPQQPWEFTDVRIAAGNTLEVVSAGRVHLSLDRLVQAATADVPPVYEWVGPEGEATTRPDRGSAGREACLLHPAFPYGALLIALADGQQLSISAARELVPGERIFAPGPLFVRRVTDPAFVHVAVNDVYLDRPDCDEAFAAAGGDPATFLADNLGFFSVQVMVR